MVGYFLWVEESILCCDWNCCTLGSYLVDNHKVLESFQDCGLSSASLYSMDEFCRCSQLLDSINQLGDSLLYLWESKGIPVYSGGFQSSLVPLWYVIQHSRQCHKLAWQHLHSNGLNKNGILSFPPLHIFKLKIILLNSNWSVWEMKFYPDVCI